MLKLLQSLFARNRQGGYPESLIREATERAVDGTDPCIRAVSSYRKKLRPSVIRVVDHVVAIVDALPPPLPVRFDVSGDDQRLRGYFISANEMRDFFTRDRNLAAFLAGGESASPVIALLAMEKQERVTFGAGMSGEIVVKDVAMVTVSFDGHRLIDPTADEKETRRALKIRAFDHILGLALKRLAFVKTERSDLERHRALLQSKLDLFQRQGWGFDPSSSAGQTTQAELETELDQIEAQLKDFGGDATEYEAYLQVVSDVMAAPETYLLARNETIFVDKLGIKKTEPSDDARELAFTELRNAEGRSLVAMLVSLAPDQIRILGEAMQRSRT